VLRALRRYRAIPVLAALAVALGAFAPAPALPCAPEVETPAPETPPCHRMAEDGTAAMERTPPTHPAPARPQPDLRCCPSKAPLAPAPDQPAPAAAEVVRVLDAGTLLVPASLPRVVVASDASPPARAPLHLLFGCFLT
jgi:hypothetical protein